SAGGASGAGASGGAAGAGAGAAPSPGSTADAQAPGAATVSKGPEAAGGPSGPGEPPLGTGTEPSGPVTGAGPEGAAASGPRTISSDPAEPVDLIGVAGRSVARRAIPAVAAAFGLAVAGVVWRRLRH
ncbi:MAG: SRPBCC family protein, partial [Acidimicrobiales bacterium]